MCFQESSCVQNSPAPSTLAIHWLLWLEKDGKLLTLDWWTLEPYWSIQSTNLQRFDNLVIQGKDVLPAHKRYPVMTQRSKLVTPDGLYYFNAKPSSLAYEFCHQSQCGLWFGGETQVTCLWKVTKRLPRLCTWVPPNPRFSLGGENGSKTLSKRCRTYVGYNTDPLRMVYEAILRKLGQISGRLVELAKRLALPDRIPTLPAQRLVEPETIYTLPAEPERMPTPPTLPAEPERMFTYLLKDSAVKPRENAYSAYSTR
ncbi:hypothetical protein TNIN_393051 [Trichonephila inaurata madagascariensis]|uniref:Uncharacterized protein n=1 Tax=Trichonephila inaurata madagascariensis TaxID=2747483 RepID=A0A8X6YXU6_9ARAC|nr:hypothetical protein TNIN_393051 [Trichonephila inaurata madagascariensis]